MKIWINKNEWDLHIAWEKWRHNTFHLDSETAKKHESYKEVDKLLNLIKDTKDIDIETQEAVNKIYWDLL